MCFERSFRRERADERSSQEELWELFERERRLVPERPVEIVEEEGRAGSRGRAGILTRDQQMRRTHGRC